MRSKPVPFWTFVRYCCEMVVAVALIALLLAGLSLLIQWLTR